MKNSPRTASSFVRISDPVNAKGGRIASLDLIPRLLLDRFGQPSPGDGNKVSGMFMFANQDGVEFRIYDWKMTGEYNPAIAPDEFWSLDDVCMLEIGGLSENRDALSAFLSWLFGALVDGLESDQKWLASLLAQPLPTESQERLIRLMVNGGARTQTAALEAVRRIGRPIETEAVWKPLLNLVEQMKPFRPAAIQAVSAFSDMSDAEWVQSSVLELLNSTNVDSRHSGLIALANLGPKVWTPFFRRNGKDWCQIWRRCCSTLSRQTHDSAGIGVVNSEEKFPWRFTDVEPFKRQVSSARNPEHLNEIIWTDQARNAEAYSFMTFWRGIELMKPAIRCLNVGEVIAPAVLARSLLELSSAFIANANVIDAHFAQVTFPKGVVVS